MPSQLDGKTQVGRWFRCSDGRLCLELIFRPPSGTIDLRPMPNFYLPEQVRNLDAATEVRGLGDAQKLFPQAF
jgi:hypothetical protein